MTLRPLGRMDGPVEVPNATPAEYQWNVTVPGQQMQTAGKYSLFVFYNGSLSVPPVVTGNGSTVTVYPGPPEPSMCSIKVTPLANTTAVGDPVAIDLTLRDSYGNPALAARNVSVWLVGPASKRTILPGSNFSSLQDAAAGGSGSGSGSSGLFRYVHVLEAQELLTVWLNVSGTTVGNATLNVSSVSPSAVDYNSSVGKAVVQMYGSTEVLPVTAQSQTGASGVLEVAALVTHRLDVPAVRASSAALLASSSSSSPSYWGFGADPGLLASLELSSPTGTGVDLVFNGSWYGANHSYVIFFRTPAVGLYSATIMLRHPADLAAKTSLSLTLNATLPPAVNFSLHLDSAPRSRVGDWVYVTPTLLGQQGQPAQAPAGLTLAARGTFSGNTSLALTLSPDRIRFLGVQYRFRIQETVVFELAVNESVVTTATVVVQGVAPALLDLPRSLAAACMAGVVGGAAAGAAGSCSAGSSSSAGVRPGVTLMVQKGSGASVEMPVFTVDGQVWQSDPGLSVVLSLVPSALVEEVEAAYASSLGATLRRMLILAGQDGGDDEEEDYGVPKAGERLVGQGGGGGGGRLTRRELAEQLQYGSTYGGAQAYDYPAYTGEYAEDNAAGAGYDPDSYDLGEEPLSPWAADNYTLPAPPLNVDSPDGVSALQEQLAAEPNVISVRGNFSTFKLSYQLPLLLTDSETYLALLSVRNPAAAGSLRLVRFWLTTMDIARLSSVAGTNATATAASFNPAVNPVVSLNLTLPAASLTSYPGGPETMLADYRALLASRAGLSSTDNVVVSLTPTSSTNVSSGSSSGSGSTVMLSFQVYFDSNWASTTSSFSSMTSLEWFYFRLANLPASVLQDKATYPDLDASVVKVAAISLDEQSAATLAATTTTASDVAGASPPAVPIILSSELDSDPVAAAPSSSSVLTLPAAAVSSPPMLTMLGQPYVEVLETETFTDPGVYVYDAIDGFNVEARVAVRLCARKPNLESLMYALDAAAAAASAVGTPAAGNGTSVAAAAAAAAQVAPPSVFTCPGGAAANGTSSNSSSSSSQVTTFPNGDVMLNSSAINAATQMYLLSYSAVNSRGTAATARYRAVVVRPRCDTAGGEFWCPAVSACSVGGVCSSGLARVSAALQSASPNSLATVSVTTATSAAADALPDVDPSTLVIVTTSPEGDTVVVSPDGRVTVVDPLSYTESSLTSSGSDSYGILGDIMAVGFGGLTATESLQQPVYVKDPLPPVITLLGSGQPALTPSGIAVMIDRVEVGSNWADPGASVWDAFDGDLTALLQTYGAAAVDTSRPTKSDALYSYMVEYQAEDLTGNLAQPARRLIRLVCPGSESICTDSDGLPACTRDGICGDFLATASSSSSSNSTTNLPHLAMVGPSKVTIQQGTPFDRCTAVVPQDQPCDPGAVATDSRDGNLDLRVMVCGVPLRASRAGQTLLPLLLACNASTATPGNYTIVYSVANSAGRSTSVSRTLVVQAVCPAGEVLCADGITCSEAGGICAGDLQSAASMAAAAASAAAATTLKPQLALITAAAAPAFIKLPRGSTYAPCPADADLTASSTPFCEPGATAVDSTGAVNLTDRVVVCPPSDCLYRTAGAGSSGGCSSDLLRRHTLAAKGLAGCGLNTLAPPGAVFHIDFWVWDDARPPYNATVRRTIVITDPCTDEAAPHFCYDGAGGFLCSPSPCDAAAALLPPAATGPNITLLPSADVAYVEYGTVSPVFLGPCASVSDTRSCGAVARGPLVPTSPSGSITSSDLTAQLSVINTTPCNMTANGNTSCVSCSLEALAIGSSSGCLPGVYTFRYSVTDDQGVTATANRTVVVYQQATIQASLVLLPGKLTDAQAATDLSVNLLNSSHPDHTSAVQEVVKRMAQYGVQASDVDILSAAVSPATPTPSQSSPASMLVHVAVHLYNPRSVHRAGAGLALFASTSQKRRRQLSGVMAGGPAAAGAATPAPHWPDDVDGRSQVDDYWAAEGGSQQPGGDLVAEHGTFSQPLADLWEALLAQRRSRELQQRRRLLLQQQPDPLDRTCRHVEAVEGQESHLRATGGLDGYRMSFRALLQTSTNSTNSTTPLGDLAASVASSLNATSANITAPAGPDMTSGYLESIVGLAQALLQMSDITASDAAALATTIPLTMGDTAADADVARGAAIQSAVSALLTESADADNRTLAYASKIAAGFEAELAAQRQVLAQSDELGIQLRELSAQTRAETDRALYVAMVAAAAVTDAAEMVMDPDCYRLQLNGFRAAFNLSRFTQASSGGSNSTGGAGGRRRLSASSTSRAEPSVSRAGGSGASSSSGSSSSSSLLPWLGYVLARGASTTDELLTYAELDVGVDLRVAAARPHYAGARIQNRVVGGLLLHTTRRALWLPSEVSNSGSSSSSAAEAGQQQGASSPGCSGGFSDLDASCHWYDVAFMRGGSTASNYLKRLFAGANSSLAPYGVDPVFLRSSSLYREDLASAQLGWYYNSSDSAQVSATGTPFGFSPRPLRGRTPGFPVLLESGLSAGRAAAMVRYLADGNYLDHRQTMDMSAELLVYNPGLRAFAYFRGEFGWSEAGSISGRLSTVGFPAMAYLGEGESLAHALPDIFARELLPLWVLAVFFTLVTLIATVFAAIRAARYAAAAAEAAARERALANALKAFETPLTQNPTGGAAKAGAVAEGAEGFAALVAGATGTVPWAQAGRAPGGQGAAPAAAAGGGAALMTAFGAGGRGGGGGAAASHIRILREEVAARKEEQLQFSGASDFSARRVWFREFVRHDGGLLYDIPLALLLIATAAFWTVFVQQHLVLYEARAFYKVYDASASANANWLLAARSDPGSVNASSPVYTQAASMGIDVPTGAGDPGRWLLPTDDSDWDALNEVLQNAHTLVNMWTTYGMLQAFVIVGLIAKLVVVMSFQERLGIICRTLMTMFTPIAHLMAIILLVIVMVAAAANTVLGDHVAALSSFAAALADTMKIILGPAVVDDVDLLSGHLIQPTVQRVAAAAVLLTKILLLLWVLFAFFFATMSHIFMKQKHSVDWAAAATVPQDLARVVLPDLLRRLTALLRRGGAAAAAAASRRRRGPAAAGKDRDEDEADAEAADGGGSGCAPGGCSGFTAPSNQQLLGALAAGGVHGLMCASQLAKTWNGRVRAAKVCRGRLLVDKATMRQLMGTLAADAAAAAAKLPRDGEGDYANSDGDGGGGAKGAAAALGKTHRELALTVARRVMERVGRTYGSKTPEYLTLERAAEAEAAARRRSRTVPGGGVGLAAQGSVAKEEAEQPSSGCSGSPPRRSLSTEIQVHMSIYDALRAATESIVRWQSGVHRWQVRTWRQMSSAYLFNQQLLAGLGVAPGPAFVERPRALQDDDLPHGPSRDSQPQLLPTSSSPVSGSQLPPLPLQGSVAGRTSCVSDAESGHPLLSPSQLSMDMSQRWRASDSHLLVVDNKRWASRTSLSTAWPAAAALPPAVPGGRPPSAAEPPPQEPRCLRSPTGQQRQAASLESVASGSLGGQELDAGSVTAAALAAARRSFSPAVAPEPAPAPVATRPVSPSLLLPPPPAAAADVSAGPSRRGGSRSFSGPPASAGNGSGAGPESAPSGSSSSYIALRGPSRWLHMPPPQSLDPGDSPAGGPGSNLPPAACTRGQSYSRGFSMVPEEDPSSPEMDPDSSELAAMRLASEMAAAAAAAGEADAVKGLPSARNRLRWGGVAPMVDEMRERLTALMDRRNSRMMSGGSTGRTGGTQSGSSGANSPMPSSVRSSSGAVDGGAGGSSGGPTWASSATGGGRGGSGGRQRDRDPNLVYNLAYSSRSRRSIGVLPEGPEEESEQQQQYGRRPSA
ncbi:hypothetical protein PLESTF_000385600 [Pleodorina starrii]|nr:hypothetical protein PLESTF_000385600 [Pleodorina starrii]